MTTAPQRKTAVAMANVKSRCLTIGKALLWYTKTRHVASISMYFSLRSGYCWFFFTAIGDKCQPRSSVRGRALSIYDLEELFLDSRGHFASAARTDRYLVDR